MEISSYTRAYCLAQCLVLCSFKVSTAGTNIIFPPLPASHPFISGFRATANSHKNIYTKETQIQHVSVETMVSTKTRYVSRKRNSIICADEVNHSNFQDIIYRKTRRNSNNQVNRQSRCLYSNNLISTSLIRSEPSPLHQHPIYHDLPSRELVNLFLNLPNASFASFSPLFIGMHHRYRPTFWGTCRQRSRTQAVSVTSSREVVCLERIVV